MAGWEEICIPISIPQRDGSVIVADGMLKNFEPLDKLAQTLNIGQLRSVAIKDIKTYFSFKNGKSSSIRSK